MSLPKDNFDEMPPIDQRDIGYIADVVKDAIYDQLQESDLIGKNSEREIIIAGVSQYFEGFSATLILGGNFTIEEIKQQIGGNPNSRLLVSIRKGALAQIKLLDELINKENFKPIAFYLSEHGSSEEGRTVQDLLRKFIPNLTLAEIQMAVPSTESKHPTIKDLRNILINARLNGVENPLLPLNWRVRMRYDTKSVSMEAFYNHAQNVSNRFRIPVVSLIYLNDPQGRPVLSELTEFGLASILDKNEIYNTMVGSGLTGIEEVMRIIGKIHTRRGYLTLDEIELVEIFRLDRSGISSNNVIVHQPLMVGFQPEGDYDGQVLLSQILSNIKEIENYLRSVKTKDNLSHTTPYNKAIDLYVKELRRMLDNDQLYSGTNKAAQIRIALAELENLKFSNKTP